MDGYVHNRAFQDFKYVWTADYTKKMNLISAIN